jgi:hypothetical protein
MIITVAKTVSRASALFAPFCESIMERMSATSITVTHIARTSVPNGSPTRCATTSAWWTAAKTEAIRPTDTSEIRIHPMSQAVRG